MEVESCGARNRKLETSAWPLDGRQHNLPPERSKKLNKKIDMFFWISLPFKIRVLKSGTQWRMDNGIARGGITQHRRDIKVSSY